MSAELLASRPAESESTLVLTLSNPGARNALHPDMYAAGIEALDTAERDTSIRTIVITGADQFFCAGGNLNRCSKTVRETFRCRRKASSCWANGSPRCRLRRSR